MNLENFKAILTRKFGPAPLWVYLLVGILGLAWYLRSQNAKKVVDEKPAEDSVLQDYALAYPMTYQGGVTVAVPATEVADGTRGSYEETHPVSPYTTQAVKPGWLVDQFILDFRQIEGGDPTLTWDRLAKLNPSINSNIKWNQDHTKNTFINDAVYKVR